jgi:hypothetical protein
MAHCQLKSIGYAVPQPMYFTWQCAMRYQNQCISPGNVLCGTTTSVLQLAMYYAVPQLMYFTPHNTLPGEIHWLWYRMTHYQMKYTDCGTVRHIARLHWSWYCMTLSPVKGTGPVYFTRQCAMRHHNQCIAAGNVLCGTTTNVFHLALCHTVPQPVYFTWRNTLVVIPYDTLPGEIHWL